MYRLVSIIIPVYNDARKFLTETLGSVSAQTRTNWECICVDDGCTDASQEMIAEQVRKDKRFRMVCHPNKGTCGARNRGLEAMRGDAFMHMDSDDLLLPEALAVLEDAAETSGAPLVAGRMVQGDTPPASLPVIPGGQLLEGEAWREKVFEIMQNPFHEELPFPTWAKLYDRAFFGHFRFPPFRHGDDTYYTPVTHFATSRCYLCNATVYFWRVGHDSSSHVRDCSPAWLEDNSIVLLEVSKMLPGRRWRELLFPKVRWMGHNLFRSPSFRDFDHWTPEFHRAVKNTCQNLLDTMPSPPTQFKWRLRFWLTLHGHIKLLKPLLPKR